MEEIKMELEQLWSKVPFVSLFCCFLWMDTQGPNVQNLQDTNSPPSRIWSKNYTNYAEIISHPLGRLWLLRMSGSIAKWSMDINTFWFFFSIRVEWTAFSLFRKKYSPESFALERTKAACNYILTLVIKWQNFLIMLLKFTNQVHSRNKYISFFTSKSTYLNSDSSTVSSHKTKGSHFPNSSLDIKLLLLISVHKINCQCISIKHWCTM